MLVQTAETIGVVAEERLGIVLEIEGAAGALNGTDPGSATHLADPISSLLDATRRAVEGEARANNDLVEAARHVAAIRQENQANLAELFGGGSSERISAASRLAAAQRHLESLVLQRAAIRAVAAPELHFARALLVPGRSRRQ